VSQQIEVSLLTPNEWERLKQIRIRALTANPEAFGAKLTEVISQPKEDWLKLYLITSIIIHQKKVGNARVLESGPIT